MEERDLVQLLKALRQNNGPSGPNFEKLNALEKDTIQALQWHVDNHIEEQASADSQK